METTPSTAAQLLVNSNVTDLLNSTNTVNFDDGPWFYAHISFMYVYETVIYIHLSGFSRLQLDFLSTFWLRIDLLDDQERRIVFQEQLY